jgi:hypothetical protein
MHITSNWTSVTQGSSHSDSAISVSEGATPHEKQQFRGSDGRDAVSNRLRAMYGDLKDEPIPDHLLTLVARLHDKGRL